MLVLSWDVIEEDKKTRGQEDKGWLTNAQLHGSPALPSSLDMITMAGRQTTQSINQ